MLEDQRYELYELRNELRETTVEAERLKRALEDIGVLNPFRVAPPRRGPGTRNAKSDRS